ncbi:MAG TPA: metal-dependent transcriptional regulator [Saprospiraceae bacterium]|nr:metal-dependent transcriptional regulator [Saprospiraceae bacterium]
MITKNEEDYLKAIFHLTEEMEEEKAGVNQLADYLNISPASVTAMLKKLKIKNWVNYKRYGKIELTSHGKSIAVELIRKHRLWETFLYKCLNFRWDEVHEVAEQLEHIQSKKLIEQLEVFLGFPSRDPHGDIIPERDGTYRIRPKITLAEIGIGSKCRLMAVKDNSVAFLKYVADIGLALSSEIEVMDKRDFDGSMYIAFEGKQINISRKFAENVFVEEIQ